MMNLSYTPGLRAVKTTVAVGMCLLMTFLLKRDNSFYACIASVVCMLPSYRETFRVGLNRFVGTLIGGMFGYLLIETCGFIPYYHEGVNMFIIPLVTLVLIYILNVIGKQGSVCIGCIVFLSIVANSNRDLANAFNYVIDRMIDTGIGIFMAMLVNRFIAPTEKMALFFQKKQNKSLKNSGSSSQD